jgi:S-adenosyl-L-methionine hydrolase (adenosine-forming)
MAIITLLSDFGTRDATVAITKGILKQLLPDTAIIDISHNIEPFNIRQAAYVSRVSSANFPDGTVHLILLNIFAANEPKITVTIVGKQYFICPDNGFIPTTFQDEAYTTFLFRRMATKNSYPDWIRNCADLAQHLLHGKLPDDLTPLAPHSETVSRVPTLLKSEINEILLDVVYIDRYENVILNITRRQFEKLTNGSPFSLKFRNTNEITRITQSYSEIEEGEQFCRFNALGNLEIGIKNGKAASLLGLRINSKNNQIKLIVYDSKNRANDLF